LSADGSSDAQSSGTRPLVLGSRRLDLPAQVAALVAAYQGRKVVYFSIDATQAGQAITA
jgi:hypothetical protein